MPTSGVIVEQLYIEDHGVRGLDWQTQAACRGTDTEAFFVDGRPAAENACTACPVIDQCREYAITRDWIYGIWGGTTKAERDRIRVMRKTANVPAKCRRGHELTVENTYLRPRGGWLCRKCDRITKRERRASRAVAA